MANRAAFLAAPLVAVALTLCSLTGAQAFDQTIQTLQQNLATLGYSPGSADGVDGRRTRAAIDKFKADHGLSPLLSDSELVIETSRAAQEETGPDPETARSIQALLTEFGYVPGTIPGVWDEASQSALWLYLTNENGRGLLETPDRSAAQQHRDVLASMELHKRQLDAGSANELFVPVGGSAPCCFSPNGRFLVSTEGGIARVWDVASGAQTQALRLPATSVSDYDSTWGFTSDGNHIITAKYAFQVIDLESGRAVRSFWTRKGEGGDFSQIFDLTPRPGSTEVLVTEGADVVIYDWASGKFLTKLHTYGKVQFQEGDTIWSSRFPSAASVAVSADGRYGASSGTEFGIRIYDLNTREVLFTAKGKAGMKYEDLAFSGDGNFVYATGDNLGTYNGKKELYRVDLSTRKLSKVGFYYVYGIEPSPRGVIIDGNLVDGEYGIAHEVRADGSINVVEVGPTTSPDGRYELVPSIYENGETVADTFAIKDLTTSTAIRSTSRSTSTSSLLTEIDPFEAAPQYRTTRTLDAALGSVTDGPTLELVPGDAYSGEGRPYLSSDGTRLVLLGGPSNFSEDVKKGDPVYRDYRVFDTATGKQVCSSDVRADWRQRDNSNFSDKSPGRDGDVPSYAWSEPLQKAFVWTEKGVVALALDCETAAVLKVSKATRYSWKVSADFRRIYPTFSPFYSEGVTLTASGTELLAWRAEPAVQKIDPVSGKRLMTYDTSFDEQPAGMSDDDFEALSRKPEHTLVSNIIAIPGTTRFIARLDGGYGVGDFNSVSTLAVFDEADTHWKSAYVIGNFGDWAVSRGGKYLAILSDVKLQTIDPMSGRIIASMASDVRSSRVYFSDDGTKLLADGIDGYRRAFDPATGKLLTSTLVFADGEWLTLTPEGFFIASKDGADDLRMRLSGTSLVPIGNAFDALYRPDLVQAKLAGDPDGLVATAASKLNLSAVIESGSAPSIIIASPQTGGTIDADSVEVTAAITDQGGGIGKIEWRVNGITLGVESRGFDRLAVDTQVADNSGAGAAKPITISKTLSLDPGENLIEIVAYNEKGLIASDPATVTVNWDGISASTPPRLYVVSVGVNDYYDSRLQLTYAASDAKAIGAAFATAGNDLYESVEVTTVLDSDVTASKLDAVFAKLGEKVRPRDVFVLFMAGHGKTQDGRYYFLPSDFRYTDESSIASGGIDQDTFQQWLARIPARKSVLLYDTCDSGSLTNSVASRGLEEVAALARMTRAMGRTVLSASTDDAPALEGYNGHGVFTYALLDALGKGDTNNDGTIEVTELAGAIDKAVPEISYAAFNLRQIPQMSIVGSDFPVANKADVLAVANVASDSPATPSPAPDAPSAQQTPAEPSSEQPIASTEDEIPKTPTHVVIGTFHIFTSTGQDADPVEKVSPGTALRVIATEGDWAIVARDGTRLGYLPLGALAPLH